MKLAAIIYEEGQGQDADALLAAVATRLRAGGARLAGAVQWNRADLCDMVIEDLATGRRFEATPPNRKASGGCRLDASVLEDAAGLAASSVAPDIDLVIVNRFGKEEVAGRGFRAVIEAAVANEIPVLTSLNKIHSESFNAFAGGEAMNLQSTDKALDAWCASMLGGKDLE